VNYDKSKTKPEPHSSVIPRADAFASAAHAAVKQVRKYTGEPYINHPREVAAVLREYGASYDWIAAALLHDVVEDVGEHMLPVIRAEFGDIIADLVDELSDKSRPEDGNREKRKAIDRANLAKASPAAQTIKLADLINNTSSIVKHDKEFARVYLKEKRLLLEVLTRGLPQLYQRAWATLVASEAILEAETLRPAGPEDQAVYEAIAGRYFAEGKNAR
jgi:(p)ppGpp synthase/HD superfamily hydrolase